DDFLTRSDLSVWAYERCQVSRLCGLDQLLLQAPHCIVALLQPDTTRHLSARHESSCITLKRQVTFIADLHSNRATVWVEVIGDLVIQIRTSSNHFVRSVVVCAHPMVPLRLARETSRWIVFKLHCNIGVDA